MASLTAAQMSCLPSMKRQHLLAEFAGLKQACPQGIYVSLTPGDPSVWSGVMFVRKGPYAPAILRFHISFPDAYPSLPPLVTFSTDMFHPLITPLTTYMYSTDAQDGGTVSAADEEVLPPGGFSLRHGFPAWFGRGSRAREARAQAQAQTQTQRTRSESESESESTRRQPGRDNDGASGGLATSTSTSTPATATTPTTMTEATTETTTEAVMTPPRAVATATGTTPGSAASSSPGGRGRDVYGRRREASVYEVLRYIRSTFDDADVLDSVPLSAAGNPGAWHAWRTHRRQTAGKEFPAGRSGGGGAAAGGEAEAQADGAGSAPGSGGGGDGSGGGGGGGGGGGDGGSAPATTKRPEEWNWEGVWEERVKRGITTSLSESVLYGNVGAADDVINFLNMDENDIEGAKSNLLRTLGAAAELLNSSGQ